MIEENIFTDGACHETGAPAAAGFAVFFGDEDARNFIGHVDGENNATRAELLGINKAMQIAATESKQDKKKYFHINTDSDRSMKILNDESPDIDAADISRSIHGYMDIITGNSCNVDICSVKGHSMDHGNEMANKMARQGLRHGSRRQ